MSLFTSHTTETAPEESKSILESAEKQLGFLPNLYANLAEAPQALKAYMQLDKLMENSSFSKEEQQVILLSASVENNCEFCVAAHSVIAKQMVGVDEGIVNAIREQKDSDKDKINALIEFTQEVVRQRGWVDESKVKKFLDAGYTQQQVLEVVLGVAMKTISNYTNHITGTEVNKEFEAEAWSKDS
ncbi:carboxymuconolactone decarboxylase family protein [Kangiella sediminilitoris]|uniref:Carboxymuconolactone decarboxylase n=1 Tax=Kangiella sediminilitoris TaxID=1144748 RepID=A0A1B3BDL6_9GAMM|nr:carboxymuconolactone decarboxylase family protein [Kangiella sediminilitoris]AOE50906.1 Carboxymuconolactone decarboxylase [Kangiella sediminilitoris]